MRCLSSLALALSALSSPWVADAHAGQKHTAKGTVERIERTRLDVKTAEGQTATYVLTAQTVVARGDAASTTASVKAGERVAVEFEEAAGVKTALKIRLGDPAKAMRYTCPMHPEVVSDKPGKCPKCGMNLTQAETQKP